MITTATNNVITKPTTTDLDSLNIVSSGSSLGKQVRQVGTSPSTLQSLSGELDQKIGEIVLNRIGAQPRSKLANHLSPVKEDHVVSMFSKDVSAIVDNIGKTPSNHASDCFAELADALKPSKKFGMIMSDKTKLVARDSVLKMQAWSNVDIGNKPLADVNNCYGVRLEVVRQLGDFIMHKGKKPEAEQVKNLAKNAIEAVLKRAIAYESTPEFGLDAENNVAVKLKSFLQLALLNGLGSEYVKDFCEKQSIHPLS